MSSKALAATLVLQLSAVIATNASGSIASHAALTQHADTAAHDPEQRRQSTGVFAEPDQAGWTQLLAHLDSHHPPAHQHSPSPPPHNQPAPELAQRQAHEVLADAVQTRPSDYAAHLQSMFSSDFQYDSPDVPDEPMPQSPVSDANRHQRVPIAEQGEAAMHQAGTADQASLPACDHQAEGSRQDEGSRQNKGSGQNEGSRQNEAQQPSSTNAFIPQVDGAADSDPSLSPAQGVVNSLMLQASPVTQDRPASPVSHNIRPSDELGSWRHPHANSNPAVVGIAAEPLPAAGHQQQQLDQHPLVPQANATRVRRSGRPRRSRQVVQDAVRLAAAAYDALDVDSAPDSPHTRAHAYDSEPQLPSFHHLQDALPARRFNSEPQLFQDQQSQRAAAEPQAPLLFTQQTLAAQTGSEAVRADDASALHARQQNWQANATQNQTRQQAGVLDRLSRPFHLSSQLISDSRATSDAQWQARTHARQAATQQGPLQQGLSQLVSDSRASSDRRWMFPAAHITQTQHSPAPQAPAVTRGHSENKHDAGHSTRVHELAWEQEPDQADPVSPPSAPGLREEIEVVISDSQPSPPDAAAAQTNQHGQRAQQHPEQGHQQHNATQQPGQVVAGIAGQISYRADSASQDIAPQHQEVCLPQPHMPFHDVPAPSDMPAQPTPSVRLQQQQQVHAFGPDSASPAAAPVVAAAPDTAAATKACVPEARGLQTPRFSIRTSLAAGNPVEEALTPVMVPHANARIQVQHAGTPSFSVVKETPQSTSGTNPWSSVKDTPWLHTANASHLQSRALQHPHALSAPSAQNGHSADTAAPENPAVFNAQAVDDTANAPMATPELTLRLSLSSSSGRNPSAMQPELMLQQRPVHAQTPTQLGHLATSIAEASDAAQPVASDSLRQAQQQSPSAQQQPTGALPEGVASHPQPSALQPHAASSPHDSHAQTGLSCQHQHHEQAGQQHCGHVHQEEERSNRVPLAGLPDDTAGNETSGAPSSSAHLSDAAKHAPATVDSPALSVPQFSPTAATHAPSQPADKPQRSVHSSQHSRAVSELKLSLDMSAAKATKDGDMHDNKHATAQQAASVQAAVDQSSRGAVCKSHQDHLPDNTAAGADANETVAPHLMPGTSSMDRSPDPNCDENIDRVGNDDMVDEIQADKSVSGGSEADDEVSDGPDAQDNMGDEPGSPEDPGSSPADSNSWQGNLVMHRFRQPAPTQVSGAHN